MLKFYATIIASIIYLSGSAQSTILADINFENTDHLDTSIIQIDSNSCWVIGEPDKPILDSACSFPNAVMTDTINPYPVNCNSSINIKVDIYYCYFLNFKLKYETETCKDGLVIEMSYDDGATWVNMCDNQYFSTDPSFWFYHEVSSPYISDTCSLFNGENGISGSGSQNIEIGFGFISVSPSEGGWPMYWKIRFRFISDSVDTFQEGFLIDDIVITQYSCPGGMNENNQSQVNLFPNPVSDILTIQGNNSRGEKIIRNVAGQIVLTAEGNSIDVSTLDDGIYLLEGNGIQSMKFVKHR